MSFTLFVSNNQWPLAFDIHCTAYNKKYAPVHYSNFESKVHQRTNKIAYIGMKNEGGSTTAEGTARKTQAKGCLPACIECEWEIVLCSFCRKFILYDKKGVRTKDDRRCGRYLIRPKTDEENKPHSFQFGFFSPQFYAIVLCFLCSDSKFFFMLLYFAGQCDQLIVVDAVFRFCILCYIHTHLHNLAYRSELLLHGKDCEYFQSFFQLISIHLRPVCGLAHHHHTHGCQINKTHRMTMI